MTRLTAFFGAIAWAATLALAFLAGRTTLASNLSTSDTMVLELLKPDLNREKIADPAIVSLTPPFKSTPEYPNFASSIPTAFRGRWDDIVTDGCRGREARFMLTATTVHNFEVEQNVSRVKLYSPTEIDIDITGYNDDKNQYNDTMMLKLVDGGKTLTGRRKGAFFFHRCPND